MTVAEILREAIRSEAAQSTGEVRDLLMAMARYFPNTLLGGSRPPAGSDHALEASPSLI